MLCPLLPCDNLVFNKTPEATDDMLARTAYERQVMECKKTGAPPPRKPRRKMPKLERAKFSWSLEERKDAVEPPSRLRIHPPFEYCHQSGHSCLSVAFKEISLPSVLLPEGDEFLSFVGKENNKDPPKYDAPRRQFFSPAFLKVIFPRSAFSFVLFYVRKGSNV